MNKIVRITRWKWFANAIMAYITIYSLLPVWLRNIKEACLQEMETQCYPLHHSAQGNIWEASCPELI
jgi:hypothetical protein